MADAQTIQDKLQALSDSFAASLPAKLDNIKMLWEQVRGQDQGSIITDVIFYAHKLAGSGASFGFKAVSDSARKIEVSLIKLQDNQQSSSLNFWTDESYSEINLLVDDLLKKKNTKANASSDALTQNEKIKYKSTDEEKALIYIQEKNSLIVDELSTKLKTYNYNVRNFSQLESLHDAIIENPPSVIIIDSTIFNTQTKTLFAELRKKYQFDIIHLADTESFDNRLEAVRIGVDFYFTKPIDIASIVDTLDVIATQEILTPARVLIVDDSISTSQFYALSLKKEGVETKIVTDPFNVMDAVIEFKPELILLDLHMPKCSGLELAAVIRQQENYISTPIIFLSGETDAQKQLETLKMGADEFLSKPVNVNRLIAVVKNKIIRYRQISAYMHNDSLTGLLNHTSILTVLDTEIARAQREKSSLSYAMIDIDFFKKINDNYGHHMGDMVIKNISRFIKQSLRITDSVGRYGGEEFVAIFPGIDADCAIKVMQKILDAFSKIDFVHFNHKFNVTFSCGIADYTTFNTANDIIDAADKALYVAKQDGRCLIRKAT